ncbi:hypothetical protein CDD82_3441 [Ophiocordyceps australis]|uniref:Major facilitator superfamily (MFS) profile domain-containing protein n=1 Tax=Ophiocordyceps australis TaxID=1399860 RepID=A0A2C5YYH1_9HYPO|nr:hypothetical protein CDD82_3441 [Ophiocordyceps australis]
MSSSPTHDGGNGTTSAPTTRHNAPRRPVAEIGDTLDDSAADINVKWAHLPRKDQLFIITLARLGEPLAQTSLQAYMFYQLKWFDPSLSDATISSQAGVLHAGFMGSQFATALLWGRIADSRWAGRKTVLLIGLIGAAISSLGFGFATHFYQALIFRIVGGVTNGNVGVMRTMISEIIREKRFQPRAFLLLPMTFHIGVIVGPILGGVLSDPAQSYPRFFGHVALFQSFPYALPNIASAVFLVVAAAAVWFALEETSEASRHAPPDMGIRLGHWLVAKLRGWHPIHKPQHLSYGTMQTSPDMERLSVLASPKPGRRYIQRLPFSHIFTRNVSLTLFAQFLLNFHLGTFNSLWFVFLSTPVWYSSIDPSHAPQLPFQFTGGLGLHPTSVGLAMAILGAIRIPMQLFLYPDLAGRLGTLRAWRLSLLCFPLTYFLIPYLAVVPSASPPPEPKTGLTVWLAICVILFIQATGRTFSQPSQIILINNCSPHPSVLGTVHGLGQSATSGANTIGPMIGGFVYGIGLGAGVVGLVWWALSSIAICTCLASLLVGEGDGHEIWLPGDGEDDE